MSESPGASWVSLTKASGMSGRGWEWWSSLASKPASKSNPMFAPTVCERTHHSHAAGGLHQLAAGPGQHAHQASHHPDVEGGRSPWREASQRRIPKPSLCDSCPSSPTGTQHGAARPAEDTSNNMVVREERSHAALPSPTRFPASTHSPKPTLPSLPQTPSPSPFPPENPG